MSELYNPSLNFLMPTDAGSKIVDIPTQLENCAGEANEYMLDILTDAQKAGWAKVGQKFSSLLSDFFIDFVDDGFLSGVSGESPEIEYAIGLLGLLTCDPESRVDEHSQLLTEFRQRVESETRRPWNRRRNDEAYYNADNRRQIIETAIYSFFEISDQESYQELPVMTAREVLEAIEPGGGRITTLVETASVQVSRMVKGEIRSELSGITAKRLAMQYYSSGCPKPGFDRPHARAIRKEKALTELLRLLDVD